MTLEKIIEYISSAGTWRLIVFDTDTEKSGAWWGSYADCKAIDPTTVPLSNSIQGNDGPDRTDPGYWLDNY